MDFVFNFIITVFIIILIFTFCGWCCNSKQSNTATMTVVDTAVLNTSAPYPVQPNMMPQPMHGGQTVPIINPYPVTISSAPPPPPGFIPGISYSPYPPQNLPVQQNPPSYAEATGSYATQHPYNSNFQ